MFWRRKWQPTPVFSPGEFHGQRNLVGYSPLGCKSSTRPSDQTTTVCILYSDSTNIISDWLDSAFFPHLSHLAQCHNATFILLAGETQQRNFNLLLLLLQMIIKNYDRNQLFKIEAYMSTIIDYLISTAGYLYSLIYHKVQFTSVTQSCLTLCNPMDCSMPGLPAHHQLPELPNSCPLSQWCHPTISSSVVPLSSCPQSFQASGSFETS